jgi:dihydrofolate reductase
MAKLTYSMFTSLDGYVEDEQGRFGWGAPEDEELHSYVNELASSFGTYLYGRRMYETMVYWETAHTVRDQPQFVLDFARQWQKAEKIVNSIPAQSGGSRPTPSTTSLLTVLNSPRKR